MKKITILLSIYFLLVSCSPILSQRKESQIVANTPASTKNPIPTSENGTSECLPLLTNFEYQIGDVPRDFDWSQVEEHLLPPQEWEKTAEIPDASQLVLVQSRGDHTYLWIYISTSGGFVRYHVPSQKGEEGTLLTGPADGLAVILPFIDRKGIVLGARTNVVSDAHPLPLLSRYSEQNNQWEPLAFDITNQDRISISHAEVDQQGIYWLLVRDGAEHQLYSIDPNTMKTERHLAEYTVYPPFMISNNSMFILADNVNNHPAIKLMLIRYSLDTETVKSFKVPAQFYGYGGRYEDGNLPETLFIDSQQRVWLGARGWIDLSVDDMYQWHFAIPDPVFIDIQNAAGLWGWYEPQITYETPDGRLWYHALRGTGWVDPRIGKWCVITSFESKILVDERGDLWLLANSWLYRRK